MDEIVTIRITDLARAGAGVAREESGRVVFVPYTAPGDLVRARIVSAEKRYAQAELVEILEPSPQRVTPKCAVFGKCGGCLWQHLPYELQWETKFRGVQHALARVGMESPKQWDELPAERIWEYRNRIQLRGFKNEIGYFARGSKNRVAIERCEIARPELNEEIPKTREEGAQRPEYKIEMEVMPSGEVRKIWNAGHAAGGFRQIHDEQNAKLQRWVGEALTSSNGEGRVLYDLYGGRGNLSMQIAGEMKEVYCVDVSSPKGRQPGSPENFHFHRSPVAPWLKRWQPKGAASAILDPPREGLGSEFKEIALALERLQVDEIVAVGCDPDAWAKDVYRFAQRGWRLERAAVLDLFPQTPHVESMAVLRYAK